MFRFVAAIRQWPESGADLIGVADAQRHDTKGHRVRALGTTFTEFSCNICMDVLTTYIESLSVTITIFRYLRFGTRRIELYNGISVIISST